MRYLITGGCGFIGSNLVRALLSDGHAVMNVDKLTYAGNPNSLAGLDSGVGYHFVRADINDVGAVRDVLQNFQPDAVFHLAAESHVDRSIDGPAAFVETNVLGTFNLLEASLRYFRDLPSDRVSRFRFLHVSTDEVFGSLGETSFFTESSPYDPRSPYSASKAASDHLARAWFHTYGLPVIVTNCSNNYGPYQFPEKLIPVVILRAIREEAIPVYGKGTNVRDWLHVDDHCHALMTVIQRGIPGETYNIGGNNELRNIDLVKMLTGILDELEPRSDRRSYSEQISFVTDRPGHDHRYAIDASKVRDELGWVPRHDQTSGFRETVEWYLGNREWWQRILDGSYRLERLGTSSRLS